MIYFLVGESGDVCLSHRIPLQLEGKNMFVIYAGNEKKKKPRIRSTYLL